MNYISQEPTKTGYYWVYDLNEGGPHVMYYDLRSGLLFKHGYYNEGKEWFKGYCRSINPLTPPKTYS